MKKIFSSKEIFHIYNSQSQQSGRTSSSNVFFDGTKVWSYGTHYLMGQIYTEKNAILINSNGYSVTTAKHTSFLRRATSDRIQFEVPIPNEPKNILNIEKLESDFLDAHNNLLTKRSNIKYSFNRMIESANLFNKYCTIFKIKNKIELPNEFLEEMILLRDSKLIIEKQNDEKLAEKRKAKYAEYDKQRELREKQNQQKRLDWLNGTGNEFPYTYGEPIRLRIKDNEVQTSHGAKVPLDQAINLMNAIENGTAKHGDKIGPYEFNLVNNEQEIVIGCHRIDFDEAKRVLEGAK